MDLVYTHGSLREFTGIGSIRWKLSLGQDKVNEIDPNIMNTLYPSVSVPSYKFPQGEVCGF